jgi:hypothetical protein
MRVAKHTEVGSQLIYVSNEQHRYVDGTGFICRSISF